VLNKAARDLAQDLRADLGKRILGPEYPLVSRIQNLYIKQILVKIERGSNVSGLKDMIRAKIDDLQKIPGYRQVRVIVDVDPT
jgi:primosomal protein N' (replication factor Y)